MKMHARDEQGTTLVELVIATAIMLMVIASIATAVQLLTKSASAMGQSTQAIDNLQVAEQDVVRDIHASTGWCSAYAPPTTTELGFTANIEGGAAAYLISITSGNQLTVATATSCAGLATAKSQALLSNVDSAATTPSSQRSGFSQPNGPASVTVNGTQYWDTLAVTLTVDSPSVSATNPVRTTVSDPVVEIWNAEEQCQNQWITSAQASSDPC
ncbi:MAG TPA: hypothetical protein VME20_05040 [Acidimicrobiales bacterium]|nr:hypothetical protein [Acidimicrobiales bacterium]